MVMIKHITVAHAKNLCHFIGINDLSDLIIRVARLLHQMESADNSIRLGSIFSFNLKLLKDRLIAGSSITNAAGRP